MLKKVIAVTERLITEVDLAEFGQLVKCPVLLRPMVDALLLPCRHSISAEAVRQLVSLSCPLCKKPFELTALRPDLTLRYISETYTIVSGNSDDDLHFDFLGVHIPQVEQFKADIEAATDIAGTNPQKSLKKYNQFVKIFPDVLALRANRAKLYFRLGLYFEALQDLDICLTSHHNPEFEFSCKCEKAKILFYTNQIPAALAIFSQLRRQVSDPEKVALQLYFIARCHLKLRNRPAFELTLLELKAVCPTFKYLPSLEEKAHAL